MNEKIQTDHKFTYLRKSGGVHVHGGGVADHHGGGGGGPTPLPATMGLPSISQQTNRKQLNNRWDFRFLVDGLTGCLIRMMLLEIS